MEAWESPTAHLLLDPFAVFGDTGVHTWILHFGTGLFPGQYPSQNPSILDFTSQWTPRIALGKEKGVTEALGPVGTQNAHPLSSTWKGLSFFEDGWDPIPEHQAKSDSGGKRREQSKAWQW